MGILRNTFILVGLILCQSSLSQNLPQMPTAGQACLVLQYLKSHGSEIKAYFEVLRLDTTDDNCFRLTNDYIVSKIYYPKGNKIFNEKYFGSPQDVQDSIYRIDSLLQKFIDTVEINNPGYAYCRCESSSICFDVRFSPIFKGVFSVEIRLRDYDPWEYIVSEKKFIATFRTEEDGDVSGYIPINEP